MEIALLSKYGTEQVGISAEIAIADLFDLPVDEMYRERGRVELIRHISPALTNQLTRIPRPVAHVAADHNKVDFLLVGGKTLSVKTNMREAGKVAPQNIGQATSTSFWSRMPQLVPHGVDALTLSYENSARMFKQVAHAKISMLLAEYWRNLFDCDYLVYVYDVLKIDDSLTRSPSVKIWAKVESPIWDESKISFSRNLNEWNESCTVRFGLQSVGEFQIHNHRDCFKFRFNLKGLIEAGLL